jgi:hypothetical protein
MLVDFFYTKQDGENKSYRVLVIDPSKKSIHTGEYLLHGLVIDSLSDDEVLEMVKRLAKKEAEYSIARRAPLGYLQTEDAYKEYMDKFKNRRIYRTFSRKNISLLRQILVGGRK